MTGYPEGWPICRCGTPVLDGHLTCGRVECDEGGARRAAMEGYLKVETRESARAEAYLCGECGYAAGVHDPAICNERPL